MTKSTEEIFNGKLHFFCAMSLPVSGKILERLTFPILRRGDFKVVTRSVEVEEILNVSFSVL